ncbi:Uma2 family endonuclease [Gloeobacter kilaueensis]|uniref:ATPase AAA-2 domain-containing protein n=1 Tax=Gloeobacter kilaueensis (strain ATCC BAA-2537 / CCAP 1431/1 / ULC 316 / JS1) TaxID=1183438 RepID=U5QFU3_GLOK1|nr:Uma2 family endonuclease [Gloeobacter kilaueensis]AGY56489.1 ATPase AAA-2 domain-containing protein [Gloeobacter kilaueensis JS1]
MFGTLSGEFTERARRVLDAAREEAQGLGYQFVSTEHLLLGLLVEGSSEEARFLVEKGIVLPETRQLIERMIGRGPGLIPKEMPFTPRARYAWEIAYDQTEQLKHSHIDTCHIFFGLVRECLFAGKRGGGAASVFRHFGVDLREFEERSLVLMRAFGSGTGVPAAVKNLGNERIDDGAVSETLTVFHAPVPVPGEVISSPPELAAGEVRARLIAALLSFVEAHKLGSVASNAPIYAGSDVLMVDVLYFGRERRAGGRYRLPDLAVLVAEPQADRAQSVAVLSAKLQLLFELGVRYGLLIDSEGETVRIFAPQKAPVLLQGEQMLQLPELLPGWQIRIDQLWSRAL